MEMFTFDVPIVCTVTGEGGSGGALAIGVGDRVNMLQYSTYSVISPEGCASILWKSAEFAKDAAEAMGVDAETVAKHGLIDSVIEEPLGGAHRDPETLFKRFKNQINQDLGELMALTDAERLEKRAARFYAFGDSAA